MATFFLVIPASCHSLFSSRSSLTLFLFSASSISSFFHLASILSRPTFSISNRLILPTIIPTLSSFPASKHLLSPSAASAYIPSAASPAASLSHAIALTLEPTRLPA
eukprot:CAMPEP_0184726568 /NCGR_PEP_ID=MMETSP0314-20130426/34082_1 /TAXON_ID=38298 /ORGANISM="Rhodella maculata, Strain CCMP 736" /LENGTH=106 /DNA_ID=CAMNT_0027192015 /DNA_START=102 /DNA_END=419 /DNA_ORIENTATION=-